MNSWLVYNDACLFAITTMMMVRKSPMQIRTQNLDDSNNDVISLIMVQAWVSVKWAIFSINKTSLPIFAWLENDPLFSAEHIPTVLTS